MKVTEFAGDATEGSQPQVRKHVVLTQTKTGWQKTMIAEIHKVSVQDAGTDAQTGQRAFVTWNTIARTSAPSAVPRPNP